MDSTIEAGTQLETTPRNPRSVTSMFTSKLKKIAIHELILIYCVTNLT
jgi:hypothetical protein